MHAYIEFFQDFAEITSGKTWTTYSCKRRGDKPLIMQGNFILVNAVLVGFSRRSWTIIFEQLSMYLVQTSFINSCVLAAERFCTNKCLIPQAIPNLINFSSINNLSFIMYYEKYIPNKHKLLLWTWDLRRGIINSRIFVVICLLVI